MIMTPINNTPTHTWLPGVHLPADGSLNALTEQWKSFFQAGEPVPVESYTRDILLQEVHIFPAKVNHHNSGTMRQRRMRRHFHRVAKSIVVKEQLLKNVYPTNIGELQLQPDGTALIAVKFEQAPLPPMSTHEIAMRGHMGPNNEWTVTGYDLVNKAQ
jgi:hypothetical protein